jgi:hypothetical protein
MTFSNSGSYYLFVSFKSDDLKLSLRHSDDLPYTHVPNKRTVWDIETKTEPLSFEDKGKIREWLLSEIGMALITSADQTEIEERIEKFYVPIFRYKGS